MSRSLARVSFAQLQAELHRRERSVGALVRRRDRLAAQLDALSAQIARAGGSVNGRARGGTGRRAKNKISLIEVLARVLKGQTMTVTDAAAAAQRAGYRTNSKSFRTIVNIALIKSGKFKRVGRGEYTAK